VGLSILVVDDNSDMLQLVAAALGPEHNFTLCSCPIDALGQTDSNSFDVIITDYQMPLMSGVGLIQSLKASGVTSRVILMSAADARQQAIDSGVVFISKSGNFISNLRSHINSNIL
jgi:two-component system, NarL family, nitrate/nitrite response regulator NarP